VSRFRQAHRDHLPVASAARGLGRPADDEGRVGSCLAEGDKGQVRQGGYPALHLMRDDRLGVSEPRLELGVLELVDRSRRAQQVSTSGESLLPGITTTHLDLAEVTEVGNGVVVLTYTPKR
jgi:hypothetical protein